ncbi:MAG: ABC transporter substrate-binding protein [Flavobacteriales bacterium]|nr:ABC transporter substrate-binding protein [Flavobacteriales bacterium]MCB9173074.1 ABC transporter substrate-binding protein [Flavobacteriales bacterium]
MKKLIYLMIATSLIFVGCGGNDNKDKNSTKVAQGGVKYGGVFKINETEDFRSLYPLNVTEVVAHRITNQVYQGLVKLNQEDLSVMPSLAEKWEINEDATSFTFYLRKGVMFHDNQCFKDGKGRELKASDVKYCLDKVCESTPENQMYWLFKDKVKGAPEYFQSTIDKKPLAGGVEGVKVIDDYTIQINLSYPFAGFLKIVSHSACWVYPKEAYDMYGIDMRINCVGTGPFKVKTIKESETVILENNPNYWGVDQYGNKLPYLDGIKFSFVKEKKAELLEFKKGNLDMVYRLPLEMIKDVVGELEDAKKGGNKPYIMQVVPAMSVVYLGMQTKLPPFDNIDVRKAFNYAVNKNDIVTYTLQGEGRAGVNGIVPPFKGYDYENVKGYVCDPEKAREHLKKAGYPGGKGFPEITLQINSGGGDRNVQIAEVVQKMLAENLGVKIKIEQLQFPQHLENLETGKALFWRSAWIADYPDPENFLNLLYGGHVPADISTKSFINSVRYQSAAFDTKFNEALREIDEAKRYELFRQADQIAVDDAATLPIFYDENTRLIQVYVKNFPSNAMEYRDMTEVYFDKD